MLWKGPIGGIAILSTLLESMGDMTPFGIPGHVRDRFIQAAVLLRTLDHVRENLLGMVSIEIDMKLKHQNARLHVKGSFSTCMPIRVLRIRVATIYRQPISKKVYHRG